MKSMNKMIIRLQVFQQYQPLFHQLVTKDIKLKYRRSFLGYLWSILNPLMIMGIMVLIFSNVFRFSVENYPVYLIIGSTIYNFVSEATSKAMMSIPDNASLMKKTYVPKYIFTFSTVTSCFVNMIFNLGAMLIVFLVCRVRFTAYMLFIPVILLQVYVFSMGLGLFLSAGAVFFRDIRYIYGAFLTAWMYATPIFYPITQLSVKMQLVIKRLNPLYSYITQFRTIVLDGALPDPRLIIYGYVVSLLALLVGTMVFFRSQDKFILYI